MTEGSYYGKHLCGDVCNDCCFFPEGRELIELGEIERIKKKIGNDPEKIKETYRERVMEIVERDEFWEASTRFENTYYLRGLKSKGIRPVPIGRLAYLCIFNDSESKACMIHPFKPYFCRNTTKENCLVGYLERIQKQTIEMPL